MKRRGEVIITRRIVGAGVYFCGQLPGDCALFAAGPPIGWNVKPRARFMKSLLPFLVITLVNSALSSRLHAQDSTYTYQGRLKKGSSPANGSYDFTFGLLAIRRLEALEGRPR